MDSLRGPSGLSFPVAPGYLGPAAQPRPETALPLATGDRFEVAPWPMEVPGRLAIPGGPLELPAAIPPSEISLPGPAREVGLPASPVYLGEDAFFAVGLPGSLDASTPGSHPVSALGLLAQLDEPAATTATRAVEGVSRPSPFGDMHMVGPGNAAAFVGNPSALYLGL